jgi:hypothetical protein
MGHVRLGKLPAARKWREVVGLIAGGGSAEDVAHASAAAAELDLSRATADPVFLYVARLLVELPLTARGTSLAEALCRLGLRDSTTASPADMTAAVSDAVDRYMPERRAGTAIAARWCGSAWSVCAIDRRLFAVVAAARGLAVDGDEGGLLRPALRTKAAKPGAKSPWFIRFIRIVGQRSPGIPFAQGRCRRRKSRPAVPQAAMSS